MASLSSNANLKHLVHYRANCLQPQDFTKPQKRVCYNFPSTERVLNPSKLDLQKELKRNLSTYSLVNNGNWARMLDRTSKEETIASKGMKSNPKAYTSSVFRDNVGDKQQELRHNKSTVHTDHTHTTQIHGLPGCVKRDAKLIKDDVKNYECRTNYARCMKRDREYGPVVVDKDPIGTNKSQFMGGYGYKDKLRSNVFMGDHNNSEIYSNRSYRGAWKTSQEINDKAFNRSKRHAPVYMDMFRNQFVFE